MQRTSAIDVQRVQSTTRREAEASWSTDDSMNRRPKSRRTLHTKQRVSVICTSHVRGTCLGLVLCVYVPLSWRRYPWLVHWLTPCQASRSLTIGTSGRVPSIHRHGVVCAPSARHRGAKSNALSQSIWPLVLSRSATIKSSA